MLVCAKKSPKECSNKNHASEKYNMYRQLRTTLSWNLFFPVEGFKVQERELIVNML